jgi:putative tricarboxylic transport membrane protein
MIKLAAQEGGITDKAIDMSGDRMSGIKMVLSHPISTVKYGYFGMFIGSIPGAGATVANFFAYGEAVRSSKDQDSFGTGNPMGVLATESSNNGTIGGSLIPTLSFGIPGSGATAVLLGALLMHGINPGPDLFDAQLATTYTFLLALLVGNVLILLGGIFLVTRLGVLTQLNTHVIIPVVVVLSIMGGYALGSNWFDVWVVLLLGVLGYFMVQHDYSIIAFLLGVILGEIAEENLLRSLQISEGSFLIFVMRPLSLLLVLAILVILLGPFITPKIKGYLDR